MHSPRVDELVVLIQDIPDLTLRFGDTGRVCSKWLTPEPVYEVEFRTEPSGQGVRAVVKEDQIHLAPLSPFDPLPETGRNLYF